MSLLPKKKWTLPAPLPAGVQEDLAAFTRPFRSILFRRGIFSAQQAMDFLLPKKPVWAEKQRLQHLDRACSLISQSISEGHPIGIFGDYDADGITATAMLTLALREIHSPVFPLIPNRLEDGYGITEAGVEELHSKGARLIITVDNGIRAYQAIDRANQLGIKVIVTDHHLPPSPLPAAAALVNPKIPGSSYPSKNLAGVGVAYKLIDALAEPYPALVPDSYLDLVAIGTVADIVPLEGENRYLVRQGIRQINLQPRQPIYSLLGAAGLQDRQIVASDISFQIAPRLNSSGRLETDEYLAPLHLLLSEDPANCGNYAQILENHNQQRKSNSKQLQEVVEALFYDVDPLPPILFALEDDIDLGVAGIAAGYLSRKFYLPAIVGRIGPSTTTASCRSIPEFDMIAALDTIKDLFVQYGGHKMAAGFTIENQNLSKLQKSLTGLAQESLSSLDIRPELAIDAEVKLSDLSDSFFKELSKLEPTGEANPRPILVARNISPSRVRRIGKDQDHLKLSVSDGEVTFPGIAFGQGEYADELPARVDIAFYFTENHFRGKKEYQLQILDFLPH